LQRVRQLWDRFFGARASEPRAESDREPVALGHEATLALEAPTRLIIGLGNPGAKFASTRHNVGFRILERLAERHGGSWFDDGDLEARLARVEIAGAACALLLPQTFMNRSGNSVGAALERWSTLDPGSELLVVYDDMDLETGRIRLRPSGGAGGHRGIGDILDKLDSKQVPRLRFGVGHPGSSDRVLDWVLQPFSADEESAILGEALDRAADAIEATLREGIRPAMGQFNAA